MSRIVELPEELYQRLEQSSFGFHKTPAIVIESMLNERDKLRNEKLLIQREKAAPFKFLYNKQWLDKSALVLSVISDYVAQHDHIQLNQLYKAFPNALHGDMKIVDTYNNVVRQYETEANKLYFLSDCDLLKVQETNVAISSDWNAINILRLVARARELGFKIDLVTHNDTELNVDTLEKHLTDCLIDEPLIINEAESKAKIHSLVGNAQKNTSCIESSNGEYAPETIPLNATSRQNPPTTKRRIKYRYKDKSFGFANLVLQVVHDFAGSQPEEIDFEQLRLVFPNHLQGPIGVINTLDVVFARYHGRINHLHFTNEKYILNLKDVKAAVSTEWRKANTETFVAHARKLGFFIEMEQ